MTHQTVTVVDFGGQYSQLIARRVRDLGVYSVMVPWTKAAEEIKANPPSAVILSGGPKSVFEEGAPDFDFSLVAGIPTLGICYGHQLMAARLGGKVSATDEREYGKRQLEKESGDFLVKAVEQPQVWMSHGTQVDAVPAGFIVTAHTTTCPIAAMQDASRGFYGIQFHPEVSHTTSGQALLKSFLFNVAKLNGDWTTQNFIEESSVAVKAQVGTGRVLCAVSGGVDSSVVAALLTKALGDQVTCVFVDHGLLRKGEAEQVVKTFSEVFHPRLVVIQAHDAFFTALKGLTDPEAKRKAIGEQFVVCFERHRDDLAGHEFLAQGTLYPDVIESGTSTAAKIKTHHNVGGLPDWMKLKLVEPMRWLFKDEVRAVGRALGLPPEVVDREPFPGPGLGVRILGEVTPDKVAMVQEADWIFRTELAKSGLTKGIWQSYAALLDVRSVGVMGDERTYMQPIVLRAVQSEDAMTAEAVDIPFSVLQTVSNRIVNEVHGVNRVVYDLTSKPPATIEWE